MCTNHTVSYWCKLQIRCLIEVLRWRKQVSNGTHLHTQCTHTPSHPPPPFYTTSIHPPSTNTHTHTHVHTHSIESERERNSTVSSSVHLYLLPMVPCQLTQYDMHFLICIHIQSVTHWVTGQYYQLVHRNWGRQHFSLFSLFDAKCTILRSVSQRRKSVNLSNRKLFMQHVWISYLCLN